MEGETSPGFARRVMYNALTSKSNGLETLSEILAILSTVGDWVRQRHGEQEYKALLEFVSTYDYSRDVKAGKIRPR